MRNLGPRNGASSRGAPVVKAARYQNVKVLGRGSFGTAYLVRKKADSFLYVMKRLNLDLLGQKERAEAMNECQVMSKLRNHVNIVRVNEHFVEDGKLHIIMEYADGGDLAQRIEAEAAAKSRFPEEQVIDWFVQICLALKHAHDRKILHRDLKPQNIFLTRKNHVRLGDFGISKVLTNTLSVASTCVGTPLYLAPELCEGKEYDNKSDIWSLGAILFELCALQPPFTANTMPALVMRICGDDAPSLPSGYSSELRVLAARLLDKDPAVRPRVHDILAEPFITSKIEGILSPEDLIEEFSHTIIHSNAPPPIEPENSGGSASSADAPARAPSAAPSKRDGTTARPKSGAPSSGRGRGKAAAGSGSGATKRGTTAAGGTGAPRKASGARKPSPAPPEPAEEDPVQRARRLKEAEEKRLAMRDQMRRDRQAQAGGGMGRTLSAFQIVLAQAPKEDAGGTGGSAGAVGPSAAAPSTRAAPAQGGPESQLRQALQQAHPGTRMLSQAEKRSGQESLARRQKEVVEKVQTSQLKGEAGREMLNLAQRELMEINKVQSALGKTYVLVRTEPGAPNTVTDMVNAGGTVAGVPVEDVAVIDDIKDDDEIEEDLDGDEDDGEEESESPPPRGGDALGSTMKLPASGTGGSSFAWEVYTPQRPNTKSGSGAGDADDVGRAQGAPGGIAFDVTLNTAPKGTMKATAKLPAGKVSQGAAAPSTPSGGGMMSDATATSNVPVHLFGKGTPLPNKVQNLRNYLMSELGSKDAFERVYDYVSREEIGEQQSGEREQILAFLSNQGKRELLPIVHTLIYLEDALVSPQ